jgi:hypothetical protein
MSTDSTSNARGAARVNFNTQKIDYNTKGALSLIENYGSRWDWFNALVCPCSAKTQLEDKQFRRLTCSLCNGTGWTYIYNKEIKMIPSSIRREEATLTYRIPKEGQMSNIYVNLTCLPENKINIRDRVVFKESVTFRSESKIFSNEIESYKFSFKIVEILNIIDENGKTYDCNNILEEKRDVKVNYAGELYWVDGNKKPPEGTSFSILYTFYPSYIIITAAHEIRGFTAGKPFPDGVQAWEDLPRLVTAKLEIPSVYLFGKE